MLPEGDAFDDASLLSTAGNYPDVGFDAELDEIDRFRARVARLVAKRLAAVAQQNITEPSELAIFLLNGGRAPLNIANRCERTPMLDRARECLSGRLWFVPHVVTTGWSTTIGGLTDDEAFRMVEDDLGLGQTPAIVVDPREPGLELRFYAQGLASEDVVERVHLPGSEVGPDEIYRAISQVHRKHLITPGSQHAGNRLWKKASDGIASSSAEDILSGLLTVGLQFRWPTCRVRAEQDEATGRLDIEIEEAVLFQPNTFVRHIIIEVKVLRGVRPNGAPVSPRATGLTVREGVTQAASYRHERDAREAALGCFDMRAGFTGEQCLDTVRDDAEQLSVHLWVWHLFRSSREYRHYLRSTGALERS